MDIVFVLVNDFVITPLPSPSSAASRHFAPRLAQADGSTRALSENTQFSEMLRVNVNVPVIIISP